MRYAGTPISNLITLAAILAEISVFIQTVMVNSSKMVMLIKSKLPSVLTKLD